MLILLTWIVAAASPLAAQELRLEGVLDLRAAAHETGHCYIVPLKAPCCPPDTPGGVGSPLRLFEDGRELGPAHSLHQAVREQGGGCFSHWSGDPSGEPQSLYFSASDNSDPTTNGRTYRWVVSLDPERIRRALHVGLVYGSLLARPRDPTWYVAVRLDRAFPPFTAREPQVIFRGLDARGAQVTWHRVLDLPPRQWVPLLPLAELPRGMTGIRASLVLQNVEQGVKPLMADFQLPTGKHLPLEITSAQWQSKTNGPWLDIADRRGLRAMRYPWHISATGEYAELTRQVTVPADWQPPFTLSFFCSDDYLDDGSRPEKTTNSIDAYPGHRFKQVLVDGTVVWERDIADDSTPAAPTDFAVDLTPHVKAGKLFTLAFRNLDRVGLDTALPTDFYLRGVYEGDRPGGNHVLATTCWWGDVTLWEGGLTEGPAWPRPGSAAVAQRHARQWPYPPAGRGAHLPAALNLEGTDAPLPAALPVVCGVPLPEGAERDLRGLTLRLGEAALPWQPEVMNTWPDGSVRWVLVNTVVPADTPPGAALTLTQGASATQAPPRDPVAVAQDGAALIVTTGDLALRLGGSRDQVVDSISRAGRPVLGPLVLTATAQTPGGPPRTLSARWESVKALRSGPVRATVEARGTLADATGPLGPVVCRLDAFAGSPALRLTYRLFNAGAERIDLTRVRLAASLALESPRRSVCATTDTPTVVEGAALRLAHPDADHHVIIAAGQETRHDGRATGWIATGAGRTWLLAAVRHFWEQFPAALEVTPNALNLDLVAGSQALPVYGCRAGEAKRWEVWLNLGEGALDAQTAARASRPLLRPLRLFNPSWFCATEGLGYAHPHDAEFAPIADHMAKTYPQAAYARMDLLFGVRDFGDGYYKQATPSYRNNYYDVMRGMFGEYLMSGDGNWFDRGEEAARHYMDIDQFHDSARSHDQRGANASVYTPNHNDEFGIWSAMLRPAGGIVTYWRLSGDEDARESALLLADYLVRTGQGRGPGSVRDNAGPLHSLTWAYDETRDPRYLQAALALAESLRPAIIARRGCYAEPHGSMNYRGNVPWMVAQLCEPLYLLYRQTGQVWIADLLVGLMESVVSENMEPGQPGNFQGYTHDPVLHRGAWNSNYNVLIGPCAGLAHELSGDAYLLDVMRGAYRITVEQNTVNDVRNCYWMTPTLLYLLDRSARDPQ